MLQFTTGKAIDLDLTNDFASIVNNNADMTCKITSTVADVTASFVTNASTTVFKYLPKYCSISI